MRALSLPAPAKLNLFLHIIGRRDDGYHNLQTVFQILNYGDELHFAVRDDGEINLRCEGSQTLDDVAETDNLVLRAARLLREHVGYSNAPGADIALIKHLPSGGGLGGGSSDAASTLLGLNALWELDLSTEHLAELGRQLGADVPVFVRGHSAWAEGIGEELTPVELPDRWYLVIHPNCHIATSVVFSHPQLTRDSPAITMAAFFGGPTRNDFENLVRRLAEPVNKALIWLEKFGEARLTGSGACVFASFDSEDAAQQVQQQIPDEWHSFVARGVNHSPAIEQLESL
jgi:4-diphosphocytidyl-2-C-methyl-D-erythritol kinase